MSPVGHFNEAFDYIGSNRMCNGKDKRLYGCAMWQ